ncbi:MAG: hypothetical protein HY690_15695 [Chloroflexi bacterium]|nr:hypothetical protein [Chloroflexota bacterium]
MEVEAKLADHPWGNVPQGVNPHHLTAAKRQLLAEGTIQEVSTVTRGGRSVTVLALVARPKRAFSDAAARKRLLYTRYIGWATISGKHPNMIGQAGERVSHASLLAAAPSGYHLVNPDGGEVRTLFGKAVPGGPLDDAAHLIVLDTQGRPVANVTVLIEVKNIRHWIYPDSSEVYDLLHKAAQLQINDPSLLFMPVLVCRRAHITAFKMAKDLGFFIIQTRTQFILPLAELNLDHLKEVQQELGFHDLLPGQGPNEFLTRQFQQTVPKLALRTAQRLTQSATILANHSRILRDPALSPDRRRLIMNQLRTESKALSHYEGGW